MRLFSPSRNSEILSSPRSFPDLANKPALISASQFGKDFQWGVSTAAYQIEGAHNIDHKGLSIWDVFTNTREKVKAGLHANVSCDFYNRYAHDLILMSAMNIPNFRFSISWSRLFPEGIGKPNLHGIDFYNSVIDLCLELNIQPWITLYHWDLPQALELRGGWTNRDILYWFEEYTAACIRYFGDRVKHWMVLNEPMAFTGAGYFLGIHAPGKRGLGNFLPAVHHAALCQAVGGRTIRSLRSDCKIGTTFSGSYVEAHTSQGEDLAAAQKVDALLNRLFIEPLLGMGYPTRDLKILERLDSYMQANDESKLQFDMDFVGVQSYTREIVQHSYFVPYIQANIIKADKRPVATTSMNWEVHPRSIYNMLKKYSAYPNIPQIIITENGAAFPDTVRDGIVQDDLRSAYLEEHLQEVLRAKREGVDVGGYFVWTLMDNFEWAEGYRPRFGLVYVDFETQKRIIKASGHWYRAFLNR